MALIACKECGKEISTEAKACPSCGAKVVKPAGKGRAIIFIVLGMMFFFLIVLISTTDNSVHRDNLLNEACSAKIKRFLKSPGTAKFSNERIGVKGDMLTASGVVDSENGFGAIVRTSYSCVLKKQDDGFEVNAFCLEGLGCY